MKYFTEVCSAAGDGENADCADCEHKTECEHRSPEILPGNIEAWNLLHWSPSVWKRSFEGVQGLDYQQIREIAMMLDIEIDASKLRAYEKVVMEKINDKKDT